MRLSDDLLERLALHYEAFEPDKETAAALRELQLARRVVEQARREYPQSDELRGRIAAYDKADHA
jgi:hypothetical protein